MNTNVVQLTQNRAVYTVAEVSHLLSLSRGNTYAMVRTGEIPSKKIGNRWVIPKTRFHSWLNDLPTASTDDLDREERALERKEQRDMTRRLTTDGVAG